MNNAAIANHLAELAAARAADTSIPARARAIRAGHYTAAAVAARAAVVELASLDAAGVRAALGCGAKIAAAVVSAVAAELDTRDQAVAGIVAHVEAGTVPAGEAADVSATLADYLAVDGARLPAETVSRVKAAIAALQPAPVELAHDFSGAGILCTRCRCRRSKSAAVACREPRSITTLAELEEVLGAKIESAERRRNRPAARTYGHLVAHNGGR